ncbi:asparagine synthetase [glutamine-hydrolyzing]-like [Nicotiana tomentosiformis]|uniref:asparagine synthetase [glutamine-hydrolyzing]-like n=1 Tax=Nicotiana tomentosiformis TaxID=4098 RepID=UPI00388C5401
MLHALQHILYRKKEQFSHGVDYSWIGGLKTHAEQHSKNLDPSGRAAIDVHNSAYENKLPPLANGKLATKITGNVPAMVGVGAAPELIIRS